jgi:uncharacterized lipoprotein YmbA
MTSMPRPPNRAARRAGASAALAVSLCLAACSSAGPPRVTYVLGASAPATASAEPLRGRPVIALERVLVPDYLDVSDIMIRRSGNVVAPSATGRWGERLSGGVRQALASDLSRRLPDFVVTTTPPIGRTRFQLLTEVEDFAPRADGTVVLLARWRLLDGAGDRVLDGERVSLTGRAAAADDAAIAAAMSRELEDLAARMAAGVRHALAAARPALR